MPDSGREAATCNLGFDLPAPVGNLDVEGKRSTMPRAIAALILMSLIWGYNWVLVKEAMRHASPFNLVPSSNAAENKKGVQPSGQLLFSFILVVPQGIEPWFPA